MRTIEGLLFEALVRAGAVSSDNADDPTKVSLQRAARTDAGVHAAGNVVSMKIIVNPTGVSDLVARVNEELPKELRLWSFVSYTFVSRTGVRGSDEVRSLGCRIRLMRERKWLKVRSWHKLKEDHSSSCDSRKYTYFFPSYLLIPPKPGSGLARTFVSQSSSADASQSVPDFSQHSFWSSSDVAKSTSREEDMIRKKKWRANPEIVNALREAAKKFEGTHNFHNFTVGRDYKERSCNRYMKKIEVNFSLQTPGGTGWLTMNWL